MNEPILSVAFFRTDAGNEPVRAFLLDLTGRMVLLHGFVKKSQKTPADDLKTALVRLRKL